MTGNISKVLIAAAVSASLTGCAKEPPKCSDEDTFTLVRNIILDQIGGSEGLTEKEIKHNLKIELARASAFDKEIKKYSCEANLVAGGLYELPITYDSQLDDKGDHIVFVGGIQRDDLLAIQSGVMQGVGKSRAEAAPVAPQKAEGSNSPAGSATDTHCDAQEQIVFSCNSGEKIVSVCATQSLTPSNGSMQYRFGPKGAPELSFPDSGAHPNTFGTAGTLAFSGGGVAYLRLMNGEYGYVVYSAITREGEKSGLVVEKAGEAVADLKCQNPEQSILGPDFFEKAGLPEDEQGFDLP